MSGGPSISNEVLGTKFIVGDEARLQTNRIQNPDAMMCPVWGGTDLSGRDVCGDSFYTKRAGCSSALDRIKVENFQRPSYSNFVTISATGISGDDANYGTNLTTIDTATANLQRSQVSRHNPRFGLVSAEAILPSSSRMEVAAANAYQSGDADALNAQKRRVAQNLNIGNNSQPRYNKMTAGRTNPNTVYGYNQFANYEPTGPRLSNYATVNNY